MSNQSLKESIVIFGNGTLAVSFLEELKGSEYIIGVDRAAFWLLEQGSTPGIAIGDFDSVTELEYQEIRKHVTEVIKHPKEKDYTDMELALEYALNMTPSSITIFGGIGSRWDHTLATIHLLELGKRVPIVLKDDHNELSLVSGKRIVTSDSRYRYISVIPLTEEVTVTLKGFAYDITRRVIRRGESIGVSNELRALEGIVEVQKGKILLIRSRD